MFDVYPTVPTVPTPQATPLNIVAGGTESASITERFGPDALPPGSATTMFIRIVKLGGGCAPTGAPHPRIALKAGPGDFVTIFDPPAGVNLGSVHSIYNAPGGGGSNVADALVTQDAADALGDVYFLRAALYVTGSAWQIQIHNNDGAAHGFTWVVAQSDAETRQPWIEVPVTENFGDNVLTTQVRTLALEVQNRGTGPLTISDAVGFSPGAGFTLAAVPGAIGPNGCGNVQITFTAPAVPGLSTAPYTVTSTPPDTTAKLAAGHNGRATLQGTARKLEVVLLLDTSGSMGATPSGGVAVAPSDSRWSKAATATTELLDVLHFFGGGMGRFCVARFPDTNPCPSSALIQPATVIDAAAIAATNSLLDPGHVPPILPVGGTPMGHGIGRVMGTDPVSFGQFEGAAASVAFNLRWLVILSDGDHNCPPPPPSDFFGAGPKSFQAKKIRVIFVRYGDPGSSTYAPGDVQAAAIIGASPAGQNQLLEAGADDAGTGLRKAFRAAITAGLSLDPTTDPRVVLTPSHREVRRAIAVTRYESKAAFVVDWATADPGRVRVEIMTPNCELITPAIAAADPHIAFSGASRYAFYGFDEAYLRNADSPDDPRYGDWTLIISADGLEGGEHETVDYEVIFESRLNLALSLDRGSYFAGDPIVLSAELTLDGLPVTGAAVTCQIDGPGQFASNWLAARKVSDAELMAAQGTLIAGDGNALAAKAVALRTRGDVFDKNSTVRTVAMEDPDGDGVYRTTVSQTTTPGSFDLLVTAVGTTAEGVAFRREKRINTLVSVRPDPVFTIWDVVYRKVVVENRISFVGQVRAFPRDRFGNVYLIDPQVTTGLELAVRGGQLLGTLVGHLDGSYSQAVQFGPDVTPTVTLKVPDLDVVVERPIVSPAKLVFADVVVEARIGHEASPGANKHADPAVVLGDVSVKDPGTFLSLGGFGSVTVGVRGQVVLGGADDDVTVFARTDGELRSYRVEALTVGAKPQWMLLGESPGAVRSFGLGAAGLDAASAVRITDTSGRVRTDDFRETDSPGASLFGVGFRRTGPAPKPQPQPQSWWVCLLEWLRRLFKILARGKGSPSR